MVQSTKAQLTTAHLRLPSQQQNTNCTNTRQDLLSKSVLKLQSPDRFSKAFNWMLNRINYRTWLLTYQIIMQCLPRKIQNHSIIVANEVALNQYIGLFPFHWTWASRWLSSTAIHFVIVFNLSSHHVDFI